MYSCCFASNTAVWITDQPNGMIYLISDTVRTCSDARDICNDVSATLASVEGSHDAERIQNLFRSSQDVLQSDDVVRKTWIESYPANMSALWMTKAVNVRNVDI